MKKNTQKLIYLLLVIGILVFMTACSNHENSKEEERPSAESNSQVQEKELSTTEESTESEFDETEPEQTSIAVSEDQTESSENEKDESERSKVLVVYFSRTGEQYTVGVIDHGNTAIVAEMIAEITGADLFEIVPADDHYPMTYAELTEVAKEEQNEEARPKYAGEVPDLTGYDTIFIGAPVWWGDWPMIMYTFFEENAEALKGKNLVPFSTHEGSGLSGFDRKLSSACPESTLLDGLAIRGNDCQNDQDNVRETVKEWLIGIE